MKRLLMVMTGALMLTAAFPKWNVSGFAWFALVPLFCAVWNRRPAEAFRLGMVFGVVHYSTLLYWLVDTMHTYGGLPYFFCLPVLLLFSAYLALYWGVFCGFAAFVPGFSCAHPFLLASCMTGLEWIRSLLFSGFPWGMLGHTQSGHPFLVQIADVTGVYGLTWVIVLGNVSVLHLLRLIAFRKEAHPLLLPQAVVGTVLLFVMIIGATTGYGMLRYQAIQGMMDTAPTPSIAVVQGNIPQDVKWNPAFQEISTETYVHLSRQAPKADLIIWPETATPFYLGRHAALTPLVLDTARDLQTEMLVGSPSYEVLHGQPRYFNSAYLIDIHGLLVQRYDKVHLVPFGEYVPLGRWLSFLGKIVQAVGDFDPGTALSPLNAATGSIGVQICYEIIFPSLSRRMVANHAGLLVNITNDAWFGSSSGPYQHFAIAQFRAVENRRTLVRAANTGISGFIAPTGDIVDAGPLLRTWHKTQSVPILTIETIYTRYGDVFAIFCFSIFIASFCFFYYPGVKKKTSTRA
jgi:apolipoprotein N-acyltransferase